MLGDAEGQVLFYSFRPGSQGAMPLDADECTLRTHRQTGLTPDKGQ